MRHSSIKLDVVSLDKRLFRCAKGDQLGDQLSAAYVLSVLSPRLNLCFLEDVFNSRFLIACLPLRRALSNEREICTRSGPQLSLQLTIAYYDYSPEG